MTVQTTKNPNILTENMGTMKGGRSPVATGQWGTLSGPDLFIYWYLLFKQHWGKARDKN